MQVVLEKKQEVIHTEGKLLTDPGFQLQWDNNCFVDEMHQETGYSCKY